MGNYLRKLACFVHLARGVSAQEIKLRGGMLAGILVCISVAEVDHIRDAVYQHSSLTAARAREYQQRAVHLENGFTLHIVKSGKILFQRFSFEYIKFAHQ